SGMLFPHCSWRITLIENRIHLRRLTSLPPNIRCRARFAHIYVGGKCLSRSDYQVGASGKQEPNGTAPYHSSNEPPKWLLIFVIHPPSNPPPHPGLVGEICISELAFQITLLSRNHTDIDHPQQRHHEQDRPQAPRRDAQPQVDEGRSQI